jgi:methylmalonyl-CoA/ethylmalonyl-CoA epimerase
MLKRLDHVGVVVDNLQEACFFLEKLGFTRVRDVELPGRLKATFWACGEGQVEVIEITEPGERARRLGTDKARVEHIAIEVDDLMTTVQSLASIGVRTQVPDPLRVGTSLNHWTERDSSDGVVYQLIERESPL